ncbi:MAG TPA: TonB-dependent receptor [Bryobacteraceae bacterium]
MIEVLPHGRELFRTAVGAGALFFCFNAAAADVRLTGRIVDENGTALPATRVTLTSATPKANFNPQQTFADPTGTFTFQLATPGDYLLGAEREGFFRVQGRPVKLAEGVNEVSLVLNPAREVFEKVDVSYSPPQVDYERTTPDERLTGTQVLEIPYPSTNTLRNALRAMPGIVQDSHGGVHLNGSTEEQILYTLDGFQINDPLTGRFESRLSVESVRSLEVTPLNPAEFGKGIAGTLAIKTSAGDDRLRYSGTNFIPGFENRKGIALTGWTPRFNVSGPIVKGRAWFSEGFDIHYDQNIVDELPKGQDRGSSWRLGNLLRTQVNLTPSNIFYASFLWNRWTSGFSGLGVLSPIETTTDQRSRQYFLSAKDQWYFARGALVEVGYAMNRTLGRDIPRGTGILIYTPEGERGNAFLNDTRKAGRDQFLANVFLPSFTFLGAHQVKTGVDVDALNYWQDASRTGYVYLRADNTTARSVRFGGSGLASLSNTESASYIQDSWKPRASLLVEAGVRQDWDRLLGNVVFSPRLGIAWAPPSLEFTKLSAGYGIVTEETSLRLFSRPLDQYALTTYFLPDGTLERGPVASLYAINGPLKTPRYSNRSAALEQRFSRGLYARLEYIGRRGHDGLTYINPTGPGALPPPGRSPQVVLPHPIDLIYQLGNQRRDVYDAFAVTFRQVFHKQYEWLASYTRSRALSNAVLDVSVDDPLLFSSNVGRMPWDAPNRVVSWGYLPTPFENWAVAYLTEIRNGYPFSVQNAFGAVQGDPNRFRYPVFFELNLHLERRFVFRRNRWAFRFGFNNITNHKNPNVVINDMNAPNFLAMYGGQHRALNFRLRWLGKK